MFVDNNTSTIQNSSLHRIIYISPQVNNIFTRESSPPPYQIVFAQFLINSVPYYEPSVNGRWIINICNITMDLFHTSITIVC